MLSAQFFHLKNRWPWVSSRVVHWHFFAYLLRLLRLLTSKDLTFLLPLAYMLTSVLFYSSITRIICDHWSKDFLDGRSRKSSNFSKATEKSIRLPDVDCSNIAILLFHDMFFCKTLLFKIESTNFHRGFAIRIVTITIPMFSSFSHYNRKNRDYLTYPLNVLITYCSMGLKFFHFQQITQTTSLC